MKKRLGILVIAPLVAINTVSILSLNSCSVFIPKVIYNKEESYSFNIGTVVSTSLSYDGFSDKDILEPVVDYDGHDESFTVPSFTYKEDYVAVSFNCTHKNESTDTDFDLYIHWRIKYTSYEKNISTTIHMIATNNIIINKSFKYNDAPSDYVPDYMLPTEANISQNNSIDILNGIYNVAPDSGTYNPQLYMNPCSKEQNTNSNVSNYLCSDFAYFTNLFADNYTSLTIVKGWLNCVLNKDLLLFKVDLEYDPVHQMFNKLIFTVKATGTLLTKNDSALTFTFTLKNVSDLADDYGPLTNGVQLLSAFTTDTSGMTQDYIDGTSKISTFCGGIMANHDVGFPHFYPSGKLITGNFLNIVPSQNLPAFNNNITDKFDDSVSYWSQTCELNAPILGDQTYSYDSFGSDSHVYTAIQSPTEVGEFAFPGSAAGWPGFSTLPSYALSKINAITPCTINMDVGNIPDFHPGSVNNVYKNYIENMIEKNHWKNPVDYSAVLYGRITGDSPWDNLTYNGNTIPAQMGKLSWYKVCNLTYDTPRTNNYENYQDRYFYGSSVTYDYGDDDMRTKNNFYSGGCPCDELGQVSHYNRFGVPLAYGFTCNSMFGAIDYTNDADGFVYHTDKTDNVFKFTDAQLEQLNNQF